jgi:hypothetical protein
MLRRVGMAGGLVLLVAAVAAASVVDGRWQGSVSGPNGNFTIAYNLKAKGTTLTGTADTPNGQQPISDGKVKGNKISFKTTFQGGTIDHQGTVSGDTMRLRVSGSFGDFDLTLKRAPKKNATAP